MMVHGTCIALGSNAALLRGKPGSGKSDLALRFLFLPPALFPDPPLLVADDQVELERQGRDILASCPDALAGKFEVRGVGIVPIERAIKSAALRLILDLDGDEICRLPDPIPTEDVLGVPIARLPFEPFSASAAIKLGLAIQAATRRSAF